MVYYRLKQVDYDGQSETTYSVPVSKQAELEVMVYPNPAQEETIVATLGDEEIESIQVFDLYGNDITGEIPRTKESGIYTLDVRALRNGTYYIRVNTQDQQATHKLMVAR